MKKILIFFIAIMTTVMSTKPIFAQQIATIGGNIYTGQKNVSGEPDYSGANPINGAKVMVQNQHSGGAFITYGTVTGNYWQASVPAPGDYIVMFSAVDHDTTSREFTVVPNDNLVQDAYLPPLPLPSANLLMKVFYDKYVNGEDDFPMDPPLNGVTVVVKDEEGNILAQGLTGTQNPIVLSDGTVITDTNGLYYFTNLPPGEVIVSSDPSTAWNYSNPDFSFTSSTRFYLTTSEEGGHTWDPKLFPGDPGTDAGGFMIWHGYVEKLGQFGSATNPNRFNPFLVGRIVGSLLDADGNDPAEPWPQAALDKGVTPNKTIPQPFLILFTNSEIGEVHPVATIEDVNPVTGQFMFRNVPPGKYKIFGSDIPIDYVWSETQVNVFPALEAQALLMLPRFFARVQGYVMDTTTGLPIAGAKVNIRVKDGSVWKSEITDANGWYNFDDMPEVEVMGYADVELLDGSSYRGVIEGGYNLMTRYIQWFTANYRADLKVEAIPAAEGDINGFVYNDHFETGTWVGDGIYQRDEERTFESVSVELYNASGELVATTTTGKFSEEDVLSQGWHMPYTWPPDEFGGVFKGPLPGYYEFRGLEPGNYTVRVIPKTGFLPSPVGSDEVVVAVQGGRSTEHNFGINTTPPGSEIGVPLAGEIEGGIFDDLNIENNPLSLIFLDKAGIPGVPVGVYDHLGYRLGVGYMGNPWCYAGSTICPAGEPPVQKPEVERRFAPGVHIYVGNDPSQTGYNPNYLPLALSYEFGQGKYKFEADWSLVPSGFAGIGGANLGEGSIIPDNAPVIDSAGPGGSYIITGHNFGAQQEYSTVSLSGRILPVLSWSDTEIHVTDSPGTDVSGPIVVATSTGISNAVHIDVAYSALRASYMAARSVYVGPGKQYATISEALRNLPTLKPRYVFVSPGTYNERVQIKESDIYIIGSGPIETIVDGTPANLNITAQGFDNGGGPVFFIGKGGITGGINNVMISSLTVTGGTVSGDMGAGIFGDYGNNNIDINNSIIVRNGGNYGGGIWLHLSNHNVKIWANTIAENGNMGGYGGGISVNDEPEYGAAHPEPEHVWDDHIAGPPPGTYQIFNNLIFHNYSPDYGGGVSLYEIKDRLKIYGNMILENRSDDHGGGMFFEDTGPVEIYGNVFLRNFCTDDGGAISFEDVGDDTAIINIYNNLFAENIADDHGENHARGGALAFDDTFKVNIYNNTIVGNIVAGSFDPVGGAIDSERNGHEYNGSCPLCPYIAPGFSNPRIFNNIIWGNWRLKYEQPGGAENDLDYTWGINYRWTPDQLHVDNPAVQQDWENDRNSESLTFVEYNDISGGEYSSRRGNVSFNPRFVNTAGLNWHLTLPSPVKNLAPSTTSPRDDLDKQLRRPKLGKVAMGAYEYAGIAIDGFRIPTGILGAIEMPSAPAP